MSKLPVYTAFVFAVTVLITLLIFYRSANKSKTTLVILSAWLIVQAMVSATGFYQITCNTPPGALLLFVPPIVLIIAVFNSAWGKKYIDGLDVPILTILHSIRVPVEIVLFWLYVQKRVPRMMTFEGFNLDMLSGLTAPLIYFLAYRINKIGRRTLLWWNFLCLGLLINIVLIGVLSAPFPFQVFSFDQPNVAILYFPYIWLPCFVVPVVLFSHCVAIRRLLKRNI